MYNIFQPTEEIYEGTLKGYMTCSVKEKENICILQYKLIFNFFYKTI